MEAITEFIDMTKIPYHVAMIMDGNGRWANKKNLPRNMGHRQGMKTLKKIVAASIKWNVKMLTVYAFSTENWKRPAGEISFLMELMIEVMNKELASLHESGVKVNVLGDHMILPQKTRQAINQGIEKTSKNRVLTLNIAFNYGARQEIIRAVRQIVQDGIEVSAIDEKCLSERLYTAQMPDPDLIIRTSGEFRISNFLLWQAAYSELYVSDLYWPDFDEEAYKKAIIDYQQRKRRFGGL